MNVRVMLDLTVSDCSDLGDLGERMFSLIGNDPDHECDDIETIDNVTVERFPDGQRLHL